MPPSLEGFNNGWKLTVMSLISNLSWNYLSQEESYRMLLARIVQGQLTENFTNSIAWYIYLNPDMTFQVKVVEDQSFDEHLSQFYKGFPSSRYEKAQLRLFGLRQISIFFHNLIIFNLTTIKLIAIKLAFIQPASFTSSSATTNPNFALTGSCLRLGSP